MQACCPPTPAAEPRALRAPHSGPPPPGSPNTKQTSRSFLQTQHPVGRLAAGLSAGEPAPLHLRPKSSHTIHLVRARGLARHPSEPRRPLTTLGPRPCPGCTPSPASDPHKAQCPDAPTRSAPSPRPRCPSHCSQEGPHLRASQGRAVGRAGGAQAEVPGRPRISGLPKPEPPQPARDLRDQGSPWQALASSLLLPQVLNTYTPRVQLYKSRSSSHIIIKTSRGGFNFYCDFWSWAAEHILSLLCASAGGSFKK